MEPYKLGRDGAPPCGDALGAGAAAHAGPRRGLRRGLCLEAHDHLHDARACASGGLFAMEKGEVRALVTREEFQAAQGEQFVNENFAGSLPRFLAAFVQRKKLTETEIDEIERLIRDHKEE